MGNSVHTNQYTSLHDASQIFAMRGPQQIHAGKNRKHLHQLASEDYDKDIPGHKEHHKSTWAIAFTPTNTRLFMMLRKSSQCGALSKSVLAKTESIFTSWLRRITTKTSLATRNTTRQRGQWHPHHNTCLVMMLRKSAQCGALSKSMLAKIESIFTSCLQRITALQSRALPL